MEQKNETFGTTHGTFCETWVLPDYILDRLHHRDRSPRLFVEGGTGGTDRIWGWQKPSWSYTTMDHHGPTWTINYILPIWVGDLHKTYCLVAISQKDLIRCLNGMRTNSMGLHTSIKQCPSMQCIVSHTAGRKELCASEPKDMDATPLVRLQDSTIPKTFPNLNNNDDDDDDHYDNNNNNKTRTFCNKKSLKTAGKVKFCKTPFNIIDFVALLAAVVELFSLNLPVDPTLLRLCRLAKLFRRNGFKDGLEWSQ